MAPPRDVTRVANTVEGQPALQMGARVGYAVSGVLHLLIAWIALQVAWSATRRARHPISGSSSRPPMEARSGPRTRGPGKKECSSIDGYQAPSLSCCRPDNPY